MPKNARRPQGAKTRRAVRAAKQVKSAKSQQVVAVAAAVNDIETYISSHDEKRARALRRHYGHITDAAVDIESISTVPLLKIVKGIGAADAARLLSTTIDRVRARIAAARAVMTAAPQSYCSNVVKVDTSDIVPTHMQSQHRAEKRARRTSSLATSSTSSVAPATERAANGATSAVVSSTVDAPQRPLVDDVSSAVPLQSIAIGSVVKTPDSPSEGLAGVSAELLHIGLGSATVRIVGARHVQIKDRNGDTLRDFDAPGRKVQWACGTMVVPVSAPSSGAEGVA